MDLNSPLFDRIRVKPARQAPEKAKAKTPCSHPGCQEEGIFRAPKGREHEGEYFTFCKDHVREYNATYDYFRGMDDDVAGEVPSGGRDRPPPNLEDGRAQRARRAMSMRPCSPRRGRPGAGACAARAPSRAAPRYNALALRAFLTLELDGKATQARIKTRFKDLVKRHHPDANGGDRSSEEKLREIIQAYNYLRANKLV